MKKTFAIILFAILSLNFSTPGFSESSSDWYLYNGQSASHSFSVQFPKDWVVKTTGGNLQEFGPKSKGIYYFRIQEFDGSSYKEAINSFVGSQTTIQKTEDYILSLGADIVVKKAVYLKVLEDEKQEIFAMYFIKHGSLILAITAPNPELGSENQEGTIPQEYNSLVEQIFNTFKFTDDWHQYLDFENKLTFAFPKTLKNRNKNDGVEIYDPKNSQIIFDIQEYSSSIDKAISTAEEKLGRIVSQKKVYFHEISDVQKVVFQDKEGYKKFERIFIPYGQKTFSLSSLNIEKDFPRPDRFDDEISETLESFEFFNQVNDIIPYQNFPDVRDNHANQKAINKLTIDGVINGYPDGTFKPDGQINRAELTKLIVSTKLIPDTQEYHNCFPDVQVQWFAPYICYAKSKGWIQGYPDGTFKPEQNVSRVEALKIIFSALGTKIPANITKSSTSAVDVQTGQWYSDFYLYAEQNKLLDYQHTQKSGNSFKYFPDQPISRKEVAETIYRSGS